MPIFKNRTAIELAKNLSAFLNLEAGIVRGRPPKPAGTPPKPAISPGKAQPSPRIWEALEQARRQLKEQKNENARLRSEIAGKDGESKVAPENLIWIFGTARTGSTWLLSIMGTVEGYAPWPEPLVGRIFGEPYYRDKSWQRGREGFILGDPHKDVWLECIRKLVIDGANARFPDKSSAPKRARAKYMVIKEPNGSIGAPLLMEALPESRMVFLVRDPRDVVSSILGANKKGSWHSELGRQDPTADESPDEFVRGRARNYMEYLGRAKEAYEMHQGLKVMVRYEDLRRDTLENVKRIYSSLELPFDEADLKQTIEKRAWENVPEEKKGPTKRHRKASPGGWREDLTPAQARAVESVTAPILDEFYPGWTDEIEKESPVEEAQE